MDKIIEQIFCSISQTKENRETSRSANKSDAEQLLEKFVWFMEKELEILRPLPTLKDAMKEVEFPAEPPSHDVRDRFHAVRTKLDWAENDIYEQLENVTGRWDKTANDFESRAKDAYNVVPVSEQLDFLRKFRKLKSIFDYIMRIQQSSAHAFASKDKEVIAAFKIIIDDVFHWMAGKIDETLIKKDMAAAIKAGKEREEKMEDKLGEKLGKYQDWCGVRLEPTLTEGPSTSKLITFLGDLWLKTQSGSSRKSPEKGEYAFLVHTFLYSYEAVSLKRDVEQDRINMAHNYVGMFKPKDCFQKAQLSRAWLIQKISDIEWHMEKYLPPLRKCLEEYHQREASGHAKAKLDPENRRIAATDVFKLAWRYDFGTLDPENRRIAAKDGTTKDPLDPNVITCQHDALKAFCQRYPDLIAKDGRVTSDDKIISQALRKECERVAKVHDQIFKRIEQVDTSRHLANLYCLYTFLIDMENIPKWIINGECVEKVFDIESSIIEHNTNIFRLWSYCGFYYPSRISYVSDIITEDMIEAFVCQDLFSLRQSALRDYNAFNDYDRIRSERQNIAEGLAERANILRDYKKIKVALRSVKKKTDPSLESVLAGVQEAITGAEEVLSRLPEARLKPEKKLQQWKDDLKRLTQIKEQLEAIPDQWPKQVQLLESETKKHQELINTLRQHLSSFKQTGNISPLNEWPKAEALCRSYRDLKRAIETFTNYSQNILNELNPEKYTPDGYKILREVISKHGKYHHEQKKATLDADRVIRQLRNQLWNWSQALGKSAKKEDDAQKAYQKGQEAIKIAEIILPEYTQTVSKTRREQHKADLEQFKNGFAQFLKKHPEIVIDHSVV